MLTLWTSVVAKRLGFDRKAALSLGKVEVNMIVTEILDAARQSYRTGKRIDLPVKAGGAERKHRASE